MAYEDIKTLVKVPDKVLAEEIQRLLEERGVYSLLHSDDPAESVMNAYLGSSFKSCYTIQINIDDIPNARSIIEENGYNDFLIE